MLKVAIVDDEEIYLESIEREIINSDILTEDIMVKKYRRAEILLSDIQKGIRYDIYFLDIELPDKDGIVLGTEIKEMDGKAFIVYVTAYERFAVAAYDIRPYNYVMKSRIAEKLPKVLANLSNELPNGKKEYYTISTPMRLEQILLSDICYICKENKNSVFVTGTEELRERKPISKILDELQEKNFTLIDKGVIINIAKVKRVLKNELILEGGETLTISRSNVGRVKKEIAAYWGKQV